MAASIYHAPRSGFTGLDFSDLVVNFYDGVFEKTAQAASYTAEKVTAAASYIFNAIKTCPMLSVVSLSGGALVGAVIGVVGGPVGIAIGAVAGAAAAEAIMLSVFYGYFGDSVLETDEKKSLHELFDAWKRVPMPGMNQPTNS